jgi:CheY-like chemotaxis protein
MQHVGGVHYFVIPEDQRVLVVEDTLPRQLAFLKWLGPSAKIVSRAEAAIEALRSESFHWIFLDRDLAEPDKSGEEVAKVLAEMKFVGKVIVHSMNPTGAEFIRKILQDAGIAVELVPFNLIGIFRQLGDKR